MSARAAQSSTCVGAGDHNTSDDTISLASLRVCACVRAGLEANYGHQQELDMIPLLMEKGYRPKVCEKTRSFVCYPLLSSEARSSFTKVDSGRA